MLAMIHPKQMDGCMDGTSFWQNEVAITTIRVKCCSCYLCECTAWHVPFQTTLTHEMKFTHTLNMSPNPTMENLFFRSVLVQIWKLKIWTSNKNILTRKPVLANKPSEAERYFSCHFVQFKTKNIYWQTCNFRSAFSTAESFPHNPLWILFLKLNSDIQFLPNTNRTPITPPEPTERLLLTIKHLKALKQFSVLNR